MESRVPSPKGFGVPKSQSVKGNLYFHSLDVHATYVLVSSFNFVFAKDFVFATKVIAAQWWPAAALSDVSLCRSPFFAACVSWDVNKQSTSLCHGIVDWSLEKHRAPYCSGGEMLYSGELPKGPCFRHDGCMSYVARSWRIQRGLQAAFGQWIKMHMKTCICTNICSFHQI